MNALWNHQTKILILVGSTALGAGVPLLTGDTKLRRGSTKLSLGVGVLGLAAALLLPTTEEQAAANNAIPVGTPAFRATTATRFNAAQAAVASGRSG